jgi:hypothetical protein
MCKQSGVKTEERRRENEKGSEEESSKFKLYVPQVLLFLPPSSATGSNVLTITDLAVRHQPFELGNGTGNPRVPKRQPVPVPGKTRTHGPGYTYP